MHATGRRLEAAARPEVDPPRTGNGRRRHCPTAATVQDGEMIRLVVTDLDGTLWLGDGAVAETTREAIRELDRRQIPLLAATARRSWSAAHYLRKARLDLPVVLLNGALGRDKGGEPIFHQCTFDPADALAALDVFERHGVTP